MENSFKVWDRVLGEWSTGSFMINQKGELREYGTMIRSGHGAAAREQRILRPADMDRYGIARCTGVYSLHGELIHEHDIVNVVWQRIGESEKEIIGEVKYHGGVWWIVNPEGRTPLWGETAKRIVILSTTYKEDIMQWYRVKIPRKENLGQIKGANVIM